MHNQLKIKLMLSIAIICFFNLFLSYTNHLTASIYQANKIHTTICAVYKTSQNNQKIKPENPLQISIIKTLKQQIDKLDNHKCKICQIFNFIFIYLSLLILFSLKKHIYIYIHSIFYTDKLDSALKWITQKSHSPPTPK